MMAMRSAAFGAEVVHAWLDDRKLGERLMRNYEPMYGAASTPYGG
jgi:hypothetical protein